MDEKGFFLDVFSAAILTVIIVFGGMFFPLLSAFFWSVPIAVLVAMEGWKPGVLSGLISFIMLAVMVSFKWAATSALQFTGIGLVLGHYFRKGTSFKEIFLKTAVVSLVFSLLVFLMPYLQGNIPQDIAGELSGNIDKIIAMWKDMGFMEKLGRQEISIEEAKKYLQTAINWFVMLLPSLMVISALGTAFFNFLGARWALNKRGYPVSDFPGFSRWWVPWYTSWGVVIGLGLALLGDYVGIRNVFIVGLNLVAVHLPVAFIIGLSLFGYLMLKIRSIFFQAVVVFAMFFYLPMTVILLLLAGVFDPLFDFRKIHFKSV